MWTVAFDQLFKLKCKIYPSFFYPPAPSRMLCCNMLCKHVKIKIMASTLFGGSKGAIYMRKVLARAGVHIILARIVGT